MSKMIKHCLFVGLVAGLAWHAATSRALAQDKSGSPEAAIRSVMQAQVDAWNGGDLEGYMRGYANVTDLTFYSGTDVTSGWNATLERYRKRYQQGGNEMGKLDFSDLEVHPLAADAAWVGGRWHLKMSDGKDRGGLFTLIFKKTKDGWRIVHDHTS